GAVCCSVMAHSAAAVTAAASGLVNFPLAFSTAASGIWFFSAYDTSTYPMHPAFALTWFATPSDPFCPVPISGHLGDVLAPIFWANSGCTLDRYSVKMLDVPLPSARYTGTMLESGRVAPGFSLVICGSFHFLILPR